MSVYPNAAYPTKPDSAPPGYTPQVGFAPQPAYAPPIMNQPQAYGQPQPVPVQVVAAQMGDTPVRMLCPNCRNEVMTSTSSECSLIQHAAFFIMCITGICTLCSCLPYCISSLGTTRHECPQCHSHLGSSRVKV